ncbi:carboxymuconolactone decarboxylase family protein [Streptomyces beihaiensis]|uniref:Carboxymuconolactone decarboxylase family protein n=1 Tax=Streptomyces beihaiensis TaxID=2984495 RepID=A0ABT3TT09_9ACTN|nr:carboxymuconolactone decarboxylase family protein [Streptomyces beihaiensis]MCX3059215.1 carboxymuconolactone decarboxylase family protein [Streptomyces beihaiensis]
MFTTHTLETAPRESQPTMRTIAERSDGAIPEAVARLATSPELLNGFLALSASLESCTLDPLAREVVIMTIAVRNQCRVCVAMHTGKLHALDAEPELVATLRENRSPSDARLASIRAFTLDVLATAGAVDDDSLKTLFAHGYTERNALEVVMAIGAYTMSTFANRLVRAA